MDTVGSAELGVRGVRVTAQDKRVSAEPLPTAAVAVAAANRKARITFPRKLYEILTNERPDVIGWTESGTSFIIKEMEVCLIASPHLNPDLRLVLKF